MCVCVHAVFNFVKFSGFCSKVGENNNKTVFMLIECKLKNNNIVVTRYVKMRYEKSQNVNFLVQIRSYVLNTANKCYVSIKFQLVLSWCGV